VIITSPRLVDQYNGVHHNVMQIGQGVDLGFYTKGLPVDESTLQKSEGSIILLGTLTDDIDYRFLKRISEKFSDRNLVLIGPDRVTVPARREQLDDLLLKENVYFLGPMPPQAFRKHLEACAVGIIAYDNQWKEANKLRSPLKAIAYLAAEKCIISNIDCEIQEMNNKGIYVTEDHEHYLMLLEKCFSGKLEFDQAAKNSFFRSIDYDTLLEQIFKNLGEMFQHILAVIIRVVIYGNHLKSRAVLLLQNKRHVIRQILCFVSCTYNDAYCVLSVGVIGRFFIKCQSCIKKDKIKKL
jgi:hypothetical protein